MRDEDMLRAAFEHRLDALGFAALDPAERERLWRSHLTQLRLSAGFDQTVAPALEPALTFGVGRGR